MRIELLPLQLILFSAFRGLDIGANYSLYGSKEYTQALSYYEEAKEIYRSIDSPIDEGRTLADIGNLYLQYGDHQQAMNFYNDAIRIHKEVGNGWDLGRAYKGIGDALQLQDKYSDALLYYGLALDNQQSVADLLGEASTYEATGQVQEKLTNFDQAIIEYKLSVEKLEAILDKIRVEDFKTSFVDRHLPIYKHLIKLLWQEERYEEAFYYAELSRSRAFLNRISDVDVNFRGGVDPDLLAQEQELRNQLITAQAGLRMQETSPNFKIRWLETQERTYKQYEDLMIRLKLVSPKYQKQNNSYPIGIKNMQDEVLDENVTLIEYFVIDDQILVWVIDRDNFKAVNLTIPSSVLEKFTAQKGVTIKALVDQLFNVTVTRGFDSKLSGFLHENLFAPLAPHIRYNNLIIVPHAMLHSLPFAALWDVKKQRYLIQDYALSFSPSASSLKFIVNRRNPNDRKFLGLGSSGFASTKDEVQTVAKLYAATAYIGEDAREDKLKNQDPQYDILHIASNVVQIPEHPLFSYMELSPDDNNDGNLDINEIYDLNLSQINLVVLSGSGTSHRSITPSDEIVGLGQAFLSSGSSSVISTAWGIDGLATAALMKAFYQHLVEQKTVSEALQAAQKDLLKIDKWSMPYFWAGFTLTGDYRGGEPLEATLEGNP